MFQLNIVNNNNIIWSKYKKELMKTWIIGNLLLKCPKKNIFIKHIMIKMHTIIVSTKMRKIIYDAVGKMMLNYS